VNFVIIEKNKMNVPSDPDIMKAMQGSGGTVTSIAVDGSSKKVYFSGLVNHNNFENNLISVARGNRQSWNFVWADN
jgi:hypothetical protein